MKKKTKLKEQENTAMISSILDTVLSASIGYAMQQPNKDIGRRSFLQSLGYLNKE
jgi:hypothetical protein